MAAWAASPEADGPVPLEKGEPGIGRGGDYGLQDAFGHRPRVVVPEELARRRPRPGTEPVDGDDFSRGCEVDDGWRDPPETTHVGLYDIQGDAGRNARIDGVAACFQHLESGFRRQIMPRRDDVPRPHDIGTVRTGVRSPSCHERALLFLSWSPGKSGCPMYHRPGTGSWKPLEEAPIAAAGD